MSVLIIGAGPAGLAIAAVLGKAGIPHRILEKSDRAGGAYAQVDPALFLLTPRKLTALPFSGAGMQGAGRVTAGEYLAYLMQYQREQRIQIEQGVEVTGLKKVEREFVLVDSQGREHRARHVVVATGYFGFPKPWPISPDELPAARFLQAGDWREIRTLTAQNVLIVGSGIFAAELAVSLSERCKVFLSTRGKLRFLPPRFLGIPIHRWFLPFERLPRAIFALICAKIWHEPLIDVGLGPAVQSGKVVLCGPGYRVHESPRPQTVINATGYLFGTGVLPVDVARGSNGEPRTRHNQSRSHKGLYIMGSLCSGGVDSKYLRGIRRDAFRIARSIQRDLIG